MKQKTVYLIGESRTSMNNAITKTFGTFYIAFEIIEDSGIIVDADCTATLQLTKKFVKNLFVNRFIEEDTLLEHEIMTRYFGSSNKALIVAYRDALQQYFKIMQSTKER